MKKLTLWPKSVIGTYKILQLLSYATAEKRMLNYPISGKKIPKVELFKMEINNTIVQSKEKDKVVASVRVGNHFIIW